MGVSVQQKGGRSVDAEINLVPFIDLMSCLVAFLLVTAVWTNLAQISTKPKGMGRDTEQIPPTAPPLQLAVLVAQDAHWVGLSTGEKQQIPKQGSDYDWQNLARALENYKKNLDVLKDRQDIEVAAEDGVTYQAIISTMDVSIAKGFSDIGFMDPTAMSVRFKQ